MKALSTIVFAALLAIGLPALAQSTPSPQVASAREPEPDAASLRAMKSKLFMIQYRDPLRLQRSLGPLGSGTKGATINFQNEGGLNTITVRDFPENIAVIEDALKRLDVPSATNQTPDLELHLHVLFASKTMVPGTDIPEELQEVLKTLKATLTYRGYTMAASFVQRVHTPNERRIEGKGLVDMKPSDSDPEKVQPYLAFDWAASGVGLEIPKDGAPIIRLRDFQFSVQENKNNSSTRVASFQTDLSFKEGEKVVVGTSVIKDRGLIVVLTARRVN
jgi:hypothetical protein